MIKQNRSLDFFESVKYYTRNMGVVCCKVKGKLDVARFCEVMKVIIESRNVFNLSIKEGRLSYKIYIDNHKNKKKFFKEIKRENDNSWRKIFIKCLNPKSDAAQRIEILLIYNSEQPEWELILSIPHAICDGMSVAALLVEIMETYRSNHKISDLKHSKAMLPGSIEDHVIKSKKQFSYENVIAGLIRRFLTKAPSYSFAQSVPASSRCSDFGRLVLSVDELHKIEAACDQFEISMHKVFCYAAIKSYCHLYDPPDQIKLSTPTDIRDYLYGKEEKNKMSFAVYTIDTEHETKGLNLKKFADDYSQQMRKSFSSRVIPSKLPLPFLKYFVKKYANSKRSQGRTSHILVSNMGKLPVDKTKNGISIDEIIGCYGIDVIGAVFTIALSQLAGELHVTVMYPRPLVSEDKLDKFLKEFKNNVLNFSEMTADQLSCF